MQRDNDSYNASDVEPMKITGKISVIKQLGEGASGSVYLCQDQSNNKFACKIIETKKYGISCIEEPFLMSTIDHPYLNHSFQIELEKGRTLIYQLNGINNLAKYTRQNYDNNKITNQTFLKWSYQIASGLEYLHRNKIIHCDVKASNILLYKDGDIKLTDYSISTFVFSNIRRQHIIGTPTHRPPEVYQGRDWDYSFDIWSLGCTLYEIKYGGLIFPLQDRDAELNYHKMISL